jgi:hypothetical protein
MAAVVAAKELYERAVALCAEEIGAGRRCLSGWRAKRATRSSGRAADEPTRGLRGGAKA